MIVHFNSNWVKIFDSTPGSSEVIAFHRAILRGRFHTISSHLPEKKAFTTISYMKYLQAKCHQIGSYCGTWAKEALEEREQRAFRPLQGIIALSKKYSTDTVNTACQKALALGSFRYHTVKLLCEDHEESDGAQLEFLQEHEIIRTTGEYQSYLESLF